MVYILYYIKFNAVYMHFCEACILPLSVELNDNERWLPRILYHAPAMCNAKLRGAHIQHWADPHIHYAHTTLGLIHTLTMLTQHWADSETIYHWNTVTCHDGEGCRVGVGLNQKQYIIKGMTRGMGLHLVSYLVVWGGIDWRYCPGQ